MNGLASGGALGGGWKVARIAGALLVSVVLGACPSATGPKPPKPPTEGDTGGGGAEGRPPALTATDHWARCEPGEVRPLDLVLTVDGASARRFALAPGRPLSIPVPAGAQFAWEVRDRDAETSPPVAVGEAVGDSPRVDVGCAPHVLRGRALAALVLVSASEREVTVEVAGLAVTVTPGARQVLHLPRGTHALVRERTDGCDGARLAVELDGAGALVRVGPCALEGPEPL